MQDVDWMPLRHSLIRHFRRRGAADPEEIAQEALVRVMINLHAGVELRSLSAYAYRVAVNVWREQRRLAERFAPLDFDMGAEVAEPEDNAIALTTISPADMALLRAYFPAECGPQAAARAALAIALGLSVNALRVKICKIRKKMV